jgi:DNA-binding GntR family transcriptional regulator
MVASMTAPSGQLTLTTLRRQVADRIRGEILAGNLRAGEKIVERKFAAQFGTSLTAVREAVIQLEAEGYIRKKPNAATYVTELTLKDFEDLLLVRRLLEGQAVAIAAERASEEDKEKLQNLFLRSAEAARDRDVQAYIRRDLDWHEAVWAITRNDWLVEALRRVVCPHFSFACILIASQKTFDLVEDSNSHMPLLQAIRRNQPEEARRAFETGLELWRQQAVDYYTEAESTAKAN